MSARRISRKFSRLVALTIDLARREARDGNGLVHLTPLEFRLLEVLARNLGLVVTQDQIIREGGVQGRLDDTRRLRTCMKMWQKIEVEPAKAERASH